MNLKVYKATGTYFGDTSAPPPHCCVYLLHGQHRASHASSSRCFIYIYKNLRSYSKFTLPHLQAIVYLVQNLIPKANLDWTCSVHTCIIPASMHHSELIDEHTTCQSDTLPGHLSFLIPSIPHNTVCGHTTYIFRTPEDIVPTIPAFPQWFSMLHTLYMMYILTRCWSLI